MPITNITKLHGTVQQHPTARVKTQMTKT